MLKRLNYFKKKSLTLSLMNYNMQQDGKHAQNKSDRLYGINSVCLQEVCQHLGPCHPKIPILVFPTGRAHTLERTQPSIKKYRSEIFCRELAWLVQKQLQDVELVPRNLVYNRKGGKQHVGWKRATPCIRTLYLQRC